MITSEILKKLAPKTPAATRDRFLPYLNEAMPRYGIGTELRAGGFLTTICFESDYFRTTVEYKSKVGTTNWERYQKKYWPSGFYGRGLIQLTKKPNYDAFWDAVERNENGSLDAALKVYAVSREVLLDRDPERIEQPFWAVESACWFWKEHNLNQLADRGKFFQIQGIVNRGDPSKKALDYDDRVMIHEKALRHLPDDFHFDGAAPSPDPATAVPLLETDKTSETTAAPSFFDRASDKVVAIKGKWDQMNLDPNVLSGSSRVTTVLGQAAGYLGLFFGWLTANPIYLIAGVVLVGLGVWYLSKSRDRIVARTNV